MAAAEARYVECASITALLTSGRPSERVGKLGSIGSLKVGCSRSTINRNGLCCQISREECFRCKVQYGGRTGVLATLRRYAANKERRETEDESVVG